jgi:hypothetical protein
MHLIRAIIPDIVDDTLAEFLRAIDRGVLRLFFRSGGGKLVDLTQEGRGELEERYFGCDGWVARFSRELADAGDVVTAPETEEFGELLVRLVRDGAIAQGNLTIAPHAKGPMPERWRNLVANVASNTELIREIIPDCVDDCLAELLRAIDHEHLHLLFLTGDGKLVDLVEEGRGELEGWLLGLDGWVTTFSQQRFVSHVEDLRGFFEKEP